MKPLSDAMMAQMALEAGKYLSTPISDISILEKFCKIVGPADVDPEFISTLRNIYGIFKTAKKLPGNSPLTKKLCTEADNLRKNIMSGIVANEVKAPKKRGGRKKKATKKKAGENPPVNKLVKKLEEPVKLDKIVDEPGKCLCGCGAEVKNLFVVAHDSRLKKIVRLIAEGKISKDSLTSGARFYVERWHAIKDERKKEAGITPMPHFAKRPTNWKELSEMMEAFKK